MSERRNGDRGRRKSDNAPGKWQHVIFTRFRIVPSGVVFKTVLIPKLWANHPGYAKIAFKLILVHIGLGLITLFIIQDDGPVFNNTNRIAPYQLWSIVHLLIGATAIVGLYYKFVIARIAWLLSLIIFNALGIDLFINGIHLLGNNNGLPRWVAGACFILGVLAIGESADSYAALKEPEINPAAYH